MIDAFTVALIRSVQAYTAAGLLPLPSSCGLDPVPLPPYRLRLTPGRRPAHRHGHLSKPLRLFGCSCQGDGATGR